jgi:hypothetical protein
VSQVLLGFRNLAFRTAIFVVLAAILVWLLGGNLFARNQVIPISAASTGAGEGRIEAQLQQVILPRTDLASDSMFFRVRFDGEGVHSEGEERFAHASQLVEVDPGGLNRAVWFAGEPLKDGGGASGVWRIYRITPYANAPEMMLEVADRLEAERQLARVKAGMPLQKAETAAGAREAVLKAGDAP